MQSMQSSPPKDSDLKNALRAKVQQVLRLGNLDELTVKRVRRAVETDLGLERDHFKDGAWREKSKSIIESEVVSFPSNPSFCMKFS